MAERVFGYAFYRVIVYDPAIANLFRTGQPIDQEGRRISRQIVVRATAIAPVSGRKVPWGRHPGSESLKNQHEARGALGRRTSLRKQFPIINKASYARYVHEGTLPIVVARGDKGLWANGAELDYHQGSGIVFMGRAVRGQRANDWLNRAGQLTAARGHKLRRARSR